MVFLAVFNKGASNGRARCIIPPGIAAKLSEADLAPQSVTQDSQPQASVPQPSSSSKDNDKSDVPSNSPEDNVVRRRAIREINSLLLDEISPILAKMKDAENNGLGLYIQRVGTKKFASELLEYSKSLRVSYLHLEDIIKKYRLYSDIQSITPQWEYINIVDRSEAFAEVLSILSNNEQEAQMAMSSPAVQKVRGPWGAAVREFSGWFDNLTEALAKKDTALSQGKAN